MRVCVVPSDFDGNGCYRLLFPARELRKRGHDARIAPYGWSEKDGLLRIGYTSWQVLDVRPDLYVLQGQMEEGWVNNARKMRESSSVVVEVDDWFLGIPSNNPAFERTHPRRSKAQNRDWLFPLMSLADAVSVSTPFLAEAYSRFNQNVHVLPNYLDWEMWEHVPLQFEQDRKVRVGWMGWSKWHRGDLAVLQGVIGPFLKRHPEVEFVAAGDPDAHDLLGIPEEQRVSYDPVKFRDGKLPDITAVMDIGLVPLELNNFNEGKSYLKGMEYAACGIPCIASPTSSYKEWVEPGVNGLLAKRAKDWILHLELLVTDHDLRRQMGRNAREKASRHTIQDHAYKWEDFYEGIAGSRVQDGGREQCGTDSPVAADVLHLPLRHRERRGGGQTSHLYRDHQGRRAQPRHDDVLASVLDPSGARIPQD